MSDMPSITLCMIVKNEAKVIDRCLNSVRGLVNEIIIVDTGSTDSTIEVAENHGAQTFPYKWNDNFSEARNYGLSYATCDWILWLDADEELDKDEKTNLPEILANTKANILALPVLNYHGESEPVNKNNVFLIYQPRLFRNHLTIKFTNRIHETVQQPENLEPLIENIPVSIHHYGYLTEITEAKEKGSRNFQLLELELSDPSHSPWIEYHIASEFYRDSNYEKAFMYVNQAIIAFIQKGLMPPSLLYKLKYAILIETNSLDGAWPSIEKAILLYPDYVDLHFYKGYILYEKKEYSNALESFDKCLELGESHTKYLILRGVGTFKAWHYKGLCLEQLGKTDEAKIAYESEKNSLLTKIAFDQT